VARCIINSIGALSSVICEKSLKIRSVGTKPLRPAVLLTAFTIICKHASVNVIGHFSLMILKARYSEACACLTRLIN
jgi:hypothetical protein